MAAKRVSAEEKGAIDAKAMLASNPDISRREYREKGEEYADSLYKTVNTRRAYFESWGKVGIAYTFTKEAPDLTPERIAELDEYERQQKERREQAAAASVEMPEPVEEPGDTHCQVCGRAIKAGNGLIAHHGYQRPRLYGGGYQTASCEGARYATYEVSCDRLKEVLEWRKTAKAETERRQEEMEQNPPEKLAVYERHGTFSASTELVTYDRPENFEKGSWKESVPRTYEHAYSNVLYDLTRAIRWLQIDIMSMTRRLNEWKAPIA
jgi:hypothetical protein